MGARTHGLLQRLRDGRLSFRRSEEDLLVGYVAALAPNLTAFSWGKTVFHDFDSGSNPSDYYKIEHECLARYNVSQEQLVSGTASESVGHCRGAWTDVGRGAPCQHRPGGGAVAACVGSGEDLVAPQPPRGPPCVLLPAGRAARREVSCDAGKAGRVVLAIGPTRLI